jgi:hypothetical protein
MAMLEGTVPFWLSQKVGLLKVFEQDDKVTHAILAF